MAVRTRRARGRGRLPSARGNAGPVPFEVRLGPFVLAALLAALSAGGVGGPRRRPTVTINASCTARRRLLRLLPELMTGPAAPPPAPCERNGPGPTGGERCTVPAAVADGRRAARDLPAAPASRAERPAARSHTRRAPRARAGGLPRRRSPRQHGSAVGAVPSAGVRGLLRSGRADQQSGEHHSAFDRA